jgi:hypothetical protein
VASERREITARLQEAQEDHSNWIDLADSELTEIPEVLFSLTDSESIDLSGNSLRTVPERLWNLPTPPG